MKSEGNSSRMHKQFSERVKSPRRQGDTLEAGGESSQSEQKRKLRQSECDSLYNRMMTYETRKNKAIQMLQAAKIKEEESEYL